MKNLPRALFIIGLLACGCWDSSPPSGPSARPPNASDAGDSAETGSTKPRIVVLPDEADLMRLITPETHTIRGRLVQFSDRWITESHQVVTQVMIPYVPPDSYELELRVTRLLGDGSFFVGLMIGASRYGS